MKKYKAWMRHPKTTQEKRANCYDREFVRGKRLPKQLPDAWDDKFVNHPRCWKNQRKTQYRGPK